MKYSVGVVGATGLVGQYMVYFLSEHPFFDIAFLASSRQKAGLRYRDAVAWYSEFPFPENIGDYKLVSPCLEDIKEYSPDIVFTALPSSEAVSIEPLLARKGFAVVSNSSNMRLDEDIPLLNPEVNHGHIYIVEHQRETRGWEGFIVKIPNCTTAILTLSLKPIHDAFGLTEVDVVSMQSVSGAGLKGVGSVSMIDNIIPHVSGEEYKVSMETVKILGTYRSRRIEAGNFPVNATCTRVPVLYGHLEAVRAKTRVPADVEDVKKVLKGFNDKLGLPPGLYMMPKQPIAVMDEEDRPQPRLDRLRGRGMTVTVGRIKSYDGGRAFRYIVLGHNLVRGSAGTAVMVGELLAVRSMI